MADPGPLIGRGRAADVFDIGGGRVLRRYRDGRSKRAWCCGRRPPCGHLAAHGFPVPAVHDASGTDLVMDRVDGVSMLTVLGAGAVEARAPRRPLGRAAPPARRRAGRRPRRGGAAGPLRRADERPPPRLPPRQHHADVARSGRDRLDERLARPGCRRRRRVVDHRRHLERRRRRRHPGAHPPRPGPARRPVRRRLRAGRGDRHAAVGRGLPPRRPQRPPRGSGAHPRPRRCGRADERRSAVERYCWARAW